MKVLVTGATGFIGRAIVNLLLNSNVSVVAGVRSNSSFFSARVEQLVMGDLAQLSDNFCTAMSGVGVVIHTAARVHIMNNDVVNPLEEFRVINRDATLKLAKLAANSGVKRFIFLSSIKVNGEGTKSGESFKPDDDYVPDDPYGLSKYEAEQGLLSLATETGMEVVIIRPPLVYGPGVKGNFKSMLGWVRAGIPLPLAGITNKRSLVGLDNLVDLIITCITHPNAAGEIFLVSDGDDLSTSELLCRVGKAQGKPARLFRLPSGLLAFMAKLLRKKQVAQRLFGSLQVDISKTMEKLEWKPPVSVDEGLKRAVVQLKK